MRWTDEHNQRQFMLMLHFLDASESGHINLGRLVGTLEGLLYALEDTDKTWESTFVSFWNDLEMVYSLSQAYQREMNDFEKVQVSEAISALKTHIQPVIKLESD